MATTEKLDRIGDVMDRLMRDAGERGDALRHQANGDFDEARKRSADIEAEAIRIATATYMAMVREAVQRANELRSRSIAFAKEARAQAMTAATTRRDELLQQADQLANDTYEHIRAIGERLTAACMEIAAVDPGVMLLVDEALAKLGVEPDAPLPEPTEAAGEA